MPMACGRIKIRADQNLDLQAKSLERRHDFFTTRKKYHAKQKLHMAVDKKKTEPKYPRNVQDAVVPTAKLGADGPPGGKRTDCEMHAIETPTSHKLSSSIRV